jgi:hypothetical protein
VEEMKLKGFILTGCSENVWGDQKRKFGILVRRVEAFSSPAILMMTTEKVSEMVDFEKQSVLLVNPEEFFTYNKNSNRIVHKRKTTVVTICIQR